MSTLVIILTILLLGIGTAGTLITVLPGVGLVYAGILLYAFADHFTSINVSTIIYFGIVALIASAAQYIGSAWAAKSAGGKQKALLGTFIGALIGTTLGPVGIFAGSFVGALAGALIEGSSPDIATKVAFRSLIGIIGGSLVQFFLSLILIASFVIAIFF